MELPNTEKLLHIETLKKQASGDGLPEKRRRQAWSDPLDLYRQRRDKGGTVALRWGLGFGFWPNSPSPQCTRSRFMEQM